MTDGAWVIHGEAACVAAAGAGAQRSDGSVMLSLEKPAIVEQMTAGRDTLMYQNQPARPEAVRQVRRF